MLFRLFAYTFLLCFQCNAGSWNEFLDFDLDGRHFVHISSFHRGLCDYEKEVSERVPIVSKVRGRGDLPVECDNVGNMFFTDRDLHYSPLYLRSSANKENLALASLQIIMKKPDGTHDFRFVHITSNGSRDFSSSAPYDNAVKTYFSQKARSGDPLDAKPSHLSDCDIYHFKPHSEDRIFYEFSIRYKDYINAAINRDQTGSILAVVLHIHTRFDMCGTCAYMLNWELKNKSGFGKKIFDYCSGLNNRLFPRSPPISFSSLVSSRQDYLVWGPGRRTLPEGPPLTRPLQSPRDLHSAYRKRIDFSVDLSAERKFAQSFVPSFLPAPPVEGSNLFYDFAIGRRGPVLRVPLPRIAAVPPPVTASEATTVSGSSARKRPFEEE